MEIHSSPDIVMDEQAKPGLVEESTADEAKVLIYLCKDEGGNWNAVSRGDFDAGQLLGAAKGRPPHLSYGAYQGTRSKGIPGPQSAPEAESSSAVSLASPPTPLFIFDTNKEVEDDLQLSPSVTGPVKPHSHKSILKPPDAPSTVKKVRVSSIPEVRFISATPSSSPASSSSSSSPGGAEDALDAPNSSLPSLTTNFTDTSMSDSQGRPKLKLSFTKTNIHQSTQESVQTPASAIHVRTPSIKLKLNSTPKETIKPVLKVKTPKSSSKKRKLAQRQDSPSEDELSRSAPVRKLTLKAPPQPTQQGPAPTLKLKYKGKLPRRPIGVGYDSENEDTERDPVILEGFVLRMQPGPDCDYLQKAINDGTVGLSRAQGGADVQIRMLDTHGRRGIVTIQRRTYAATLVDLPCVVEGMKSWDRKGWIKSVDVCQMLLVLGRCGGDEEARNYKLPPDVDPKSYQYAHGLTAPMRWVRRRRFVRTKRARVDDIEAIERRVHALLAADDEAVSTSYTLFDHDPHEDEEGEESGEFESEQEDEEMEGEEDYFAGHGDQHGGNLQNPVYQEDEIAELEAMMEDNDEEEDDRLPEPKLAGLKNSLHPPDEASSFAVTSTSASPSATQAHTPVSVAEEGSSDDEEEEEEDEEDGEGEDDEGDENRQQALDRITDLQKKIRQQKEAMRATENMILRKKIAVKIRGFEGDVEQIRRGAGLGDEEGDEEEGEGKD